MDANTGCSAVGREDVAVENIEYNGTDTLKGVYDVTVNKCSACSVTGPSTWVLQVFVNGMRILLRNGSHEGSETGIVGTFNFTYLC